MKNVLKLAFVFLLLITASCSNENTDVILPQEPNAASPALISNLRTYATTANSTNQQSSYVNNSQSSSECFTINFPFNVSDGTTSVQINSDAEFENYILGIDPSISWSIELPFTVTLEDGTQQTIENENQLFFLLEDCGFIDITDVSYVDDCFQLDYPLDVIDDIGNQITVNSNEELYTFPNFIGFVFPITGTLADGSSVTVNSSEEFDTIYNDCYGIEDCVDCQENCFEVVFPMSFVNQNGTITTVNDENELFDFLTQLDDTDVITISYPINVVLEDGTQQAINSDIEFEALLEACYN